MKEYDLTALAFVKWINQYNNSDLFKTADNLADEENELKNKIIDEVLETFNIKRSLSKKDCPYDNAVADVTYKVIKTEFAFNRIFNSF